MTRRRLITSIVVLALASGLVQLAIWWLKPPPKPRQLVGPPRSGYTLSDFTLYAYAPDGTLSFKLQSPSLQRREGDHSLYIDKPHFLLPPKNGETGAPWRGRSDYGWVSADHTVLKLMGQVDMHRKASANAPSAEIHTSDVTAWPEQNRLATTKAAHMRQGTSRMSSVGLRANFDSKHLELMHDFHGTFAPSSQR
ncbi:MAG TPA: LPS export ABC transporter periplasmic protein LptC [Rhodanobacteraceae bacterium]|nr:LPS export ABC transporter periplasmic protein LptC [Rhodanobacteraceae bacterium]